MDVPSYRQIYITNKKVKASLIARTQGKIPAPKLTNHIQPVMGTEYIIQTADGSLISIVEDGAPKLGSGDGVLLIHGPPVKLVMDPTNT